MRTHDPGFKPPWCPWAGCRLYGKSEGFRCRSAGTHSRKALPQTIRRFQCLTCRRTFSTQTFDTTYWLKRPDLQQPIYESLVSCSAFRQTGRALRVAGSTVQRQASRLGRHCLLYQAAHGAKGRPSEPLVLDGLLSFESSKYWPFELNVLVGQQSDYFYGFTEAELRRSGRMTTGQKRRRAKLEEDLGRPDPKATRSSVEALFGIVAPGGGDLVVHSDEHKTYPRAFQRLPHRIEHHAVSSRRNRNRANPLFVVDLLDLLLRHGGSNHKRGTIAFSKRRQGAVERAAVTQVWRNFQKRRSERRGDSPTPAQSLGLTDRPLQTEEILLRRLFPSLVQLPQALESYYYRRIVTRCIPKGTRHALRFAT